MIGRRFFLGLVIFLSTLNAHAAVGILDRQGTQLRTNEMRFTDETGKAVTLNSYFHPGRPVLLTLVYFGCPGVCTATLTNLVNSLKMVNPSPGKAFEVVVVSIDPRENSDLARAKKASYLKVYARPETAAGWHFLTGDEANIAILSDALGFQFERDSTTNLINHPAVLYVLSPEAKLTTAFAGTTFQHRDLRVALFEAEEGRVKAMINRLNSYCYAYMPHSGVINLWVLVVSILCIGIAGYLILSAVKKRYPGYR